jgi:hypothetical protein
VVTYTPTTDYVGADSFTFTANDGTLTSTPATVSITVNAVNTAPVANAQVVSTAEDTAKDITLAATDVDGDALTYSIVTPPTHGSLGTITGSSVTYTPAANYNGADSFTFTANDGSLTSAPAAVSITVTAANDAPVANAQAVSMAEDTAKDITLVAPDVDGDALTYSIVTPPTHGSLGTITGSSVTYTPAANYIGADSFTFKARDSTADSNVATVSITISADIAKTPTERIQDLIEHIRSLHLRQGTENSVTAKLNAAIQSLERGNTHSAKNQLNACIHEIAAQTGKTITDEHVASLAANIQQINQLL